MDISIIIPVFNKIEVIKHCIELNIRHCSKPRNWIIIDNNSDIDTKNGLLDLQKYANSVGHTFFIHTEKENTGVARAWNKGLSMVNTKYVCILNNDCVMMPNWDCEMMEKSEYHHLGISTPLVLESEMFNVNYNLNSFLNGRKNWKYLSKKNEIGRAHV